MDDLISRSAAIDAIEYELEMINSALDSITLDFNARERLRQRRGEAREILNSIQQLPSAQPFHNIAMNDVLKYIDGMPEDVWQEFTACLECRGWELQRRTTKRFCMSDLIERQAAIDAVNQYNFDFPQYMERFVTELRDAMKADLKHDIEALPSVQPEQRWILCSERLPEPDERVLVYTVGNEYHVWDAMPHRADSYVWEDEEGLCHSLYEVDLWMPLPEPYAERRNDE